jgi:hypothetical protein
MFADVMVGGKVGPIILPEYGIRIVLLCAISLEFISAEVNCSTSESD